MKLINKSIYALSLAAALGLASCSTDEFMPDVDNTTGRSVPVTVTVSRGDAQTRTILTENGNSLSDVWEKSDQLTVIDSNGAIVGHLSLTDWTNDAHNTAVFEGNLENVTNGEHAYKVWYLGKKDAEGNTYSGFENFTDASGGVFNNAIKTVLNKQDGSLGNLTKGDLMHASLDLIVTDKQAVVKNDITMTKLLAMGKFSLAAAEGMTNGTLTITSVNGGGNAIGYGLYFSSTTAENVKTVSSADTKQITISNVSANDPVYVVLTPVTDTKITFTLTSGNDTWTYTSNPNTLEAGKYYCVEDGSGLPLAFTKTSTEKPVDHSKNPLLKWAETNLYFSGSTADQTSQLAAPGSYKNPDASSLYQFGRNKGWNKWSIANSMSGMASPNSDGAGTIACSNLAGTSSIAWYPAISTEGPLYINNFLLNSEYNKTSDYTDYWPARNSDNDWNTRAKACGFTQNICPNGYRIPSYADFKAIFPTEQNITDPDKLIYGITEIRETAHGKCAFNWKIAKFDNGTYTFQISALMVDDKTSISDINWKDKNVIIRHFGATGQIVPYVVKMYVYRYYDYYEGYVYNASPTPLGSSYGSYFGSQMLAGAIPDGEAYTEALVNSSNKVYVKFTVTKEIRNLSGHYWTSDGYSMQFCFDNNLVLSDDAAYARLVKEPKHSAFAIRCINTAIEAEQNAN